MKTNKYSIKLMGAILAGGTIFSLGAMGYAKDIPFNSKSAVGDAIVTKGLIQQSQTKLDTAKLQEDLGKKIDQLMKDRLESILKELVSEGKFTQETADKLIEFQDKVAQRDKDVLSTEKNIGSSQKRDAYTLAVVNGIITEEQADMIRDKVSKNEADQRHQIMKRSLEKLITDSTITDEQADKAVDCYEAVNQEVKVVMDKSRSMSATERKEYIQKAYEEYKSPLDKLVEDKVLTQEQADKIAKCVPNSGAILKNYADVLDKFDEMAKNKPSIK